MVFTFTRQAAPQFGSGSPVRIDARIVARTREQAIREWVRRALAPPTR